MSFFNFNPTQLTKDKHLLKICLKMGKIGEEKPQYLAKIEKLLQNGANPNLHIGKQELAEIKNYDGDETLLMINCAMGNLQTVKLLLSYGADIHVVTTKNKIHALFFCDHLLGFYCTHLLDYMKSPEIFSKQKDIGRVLIQNGINVEKRNNFGETFLDLIPKSNKKYDIWKTIFLEETINLNRKNLEECIPEAVIRKMKPKI